MTTLFQIPTPTESNQTIRVALDGATYSMRWLWNVRDCHWTVALETAEGEPIVSGLKAITGWDILQDVRNELRPPGALVFIDQSTAGDTISGEDPGEDDLGDRVLLYYLPIAAQGDLA